MAYKGGHITVENCKFIGADTAALHYRGNDVTIRNNLFQYNDWSGISGGGTGPKAALQSHCKTTRQIQFAGEKIVHNTFLYGGATQAFSPCAAAEAIENLIVGTRHG